MKIILSAIYLIVLNVILTILSLILNIMFLALFFSIYALGDTSNEDINLIIILSLLLSIIILVPLLGTIFSRLVFYATRILFNIKFSLNHWFHIFITPIIAGTILSALLTLYTIFAGANSYTFNLAQKSLHTFLVSGVALFVLFTVMNVLISSCTELYKALNSKAKL